MQSLYSFFLGTNDSHPRGTRPFRHVAICVIRACYKLLPDGEDRQKLISKTFILCKENQLVSKQVLTEIFKAHLKLPVDELKEEGIVLDTSWSGKLCYRAEIDPSES